MIKTEALQTRILETLTYPKLENRETFTLLYFK